LLLELLKSSDYAVNVAVLESDVENWALIEVAKGQSIVAGHSSVVFNPGALRGCVTTSGSLR